MKKVLFVVLVAVLSIGCKANQNKSDDNKLCDSIVVLIQQGFTIIIVPLSLILWDVRMKL